MPDRSKDRGQKKLSPWSSRLGVVQTTLPQKNLLLQNHGGAQDPNRVAAPVKEGGIVKYFEDLFEIWAFLL
jgi:hypothetical protein